MKKTHLHYYFYGQFTESPILSIRTPAHILSISQSLLRNFFKEIKIFSFKPNSYKVSDEEKHLEFGLLADTNYVESRKISRIIIN